MSGATIEISSHYSKLLQQCRSSVSSLTHLAVDHDRPMTKRCEIVTERVDRKMIEPSIAPAACSSAVRTSMTGHPFSRVGPTPETNDVAVSAQHILRHIAEEVDGILGG